MSSPPGGCCSNAHDLLRNGLWREDEIHTAAGDRRFRHVRKIGAVWGLGNRNAANVPDLSQGRCAIAVITGNNHGD